MRLSMQLVRNATWLIFATVFLLMTAYIQQQNDARVVVLFAARDLPAGAIVSGGDIRIGSVHPHDFRAGEMLTQEHESSVLGAVVARDILQNEPLARGRLASVDGRFSTRYSDLVGDPRARLLSWPANEVSLVSQLRGGDMVDLTVVIGDKSAGGAVVSKTVVQRVKVVAVSGTDILMLVPAELVEPLLFARTQGLVEFSLAGPNAERVDTSGVNFEQFKQRYLVTPPSSSPVPIGTATPPGGSATPVPSPGLPSASSSPAPVPSNAPSPSPTVRP